MVGLANRTNLIAEFGRDLFVQGNTSIPNILLRSYKNMGITDQEFVVLVHLLYLRASENEPYPSVERLLSLMSSQKSEIEEILKRLIEKKVISTEKRIDTETLEFESVYNLEGLFDKLAEVWAIERNNEYEEQQFYLAKQKQESMGQGFQGHLSLRKKTVSETATKVYKAFESEFGRPLSPIESELIMGWCDQLPSELILEALRISVIQGIFNLRYIERILQEWQRKNIRSLSEVRKLEEAFSEKKAQFNKTSRSRVYPGESIKRTLNGEDRYKDEKYRDLYSI